MTKFESFIERIDRAPTCSVDVATAALILDTTPDDVRDAIPQRTLRELIYDEVDLGAVGQLYRRLHPPPADAPRTTYRFGREVLELVYD